MLKNLVLFAFSFSMLVGCQKQNLTTNFPSGFGQDNSIIGGKPFEEVNQKAATVGVYMSGGYCSGSYIGNNKVVTASHCIHDGTAMNVKFNDAAGAFACKVTEQFEHPDYKVSQDPWYDVAVLKINCTDARIAQIRPYKLATAADSIGRIYAAGYGLSSENGGYNFPRLSYMELIPFDVKDALVDKTIPDSMKLSDKLAELDQRVQEGRISCYRSSISETVFFGDSGGPTYFLNKDGSYSLMGINDVLYTRTEDVASLYSFCAAHVAYYTDWILAQ